MFTLQVLSSKPAGHISYIRSPLRIASVVPHIIQELNPDSINWTTFRTSALKTVLYMEHPCTPAHLQTIKLAQLMGVKVWVDWAYDPFLLDQPGDPAFELMAQSEISAAVIDCFRLADHVTSAVDFSFLVPCKKPPQKRGMLPFWLANSVPTSKKVVFRTTKNWEKELWEDAADIAMMMEAGYELNVFSPVNPWFLECENLKWHGHVSPPAFYAWLAAEKPETLLRRKKDTDHFKSFDASHASANVRTAEQILRQVSVPTPQFPFSTWTNEEDIIADVVRGI